MLPVVLLVMFVMLMMVVMLLWVLGNRVSTETVGTSRAAYHTNAAQTVV